jgi:hypothetical protein
MRKVWVVVVGGVLVLAACGRGVMPGSGEDGVEPEVAGEEARFGSTIWQIRGHHLVSLELYGSGEKAPALAHAHHPLGEVLPSVKGEIEEQDAAAADALELALEEAVELVEGDAPSDEVQAAYDRALGALRDAEAAVVGEPSSPAYVGSVVAGLLATSAHEYEEAAPEGEITNIEEYEDAYGFLLAAKELYEEIATAIQERAAHEAEEIEEAFGQLEQAFPGPRPPAHLAGVGDVEKLAAVIGHELEETVGAIVATEVEAEEVWENIETLLDQVLAEYREGEAEEAAELAAEAYLENYELIEADVITAAPDLNAELEPLLAAELRAAIGEGVPAEELEHLIERAKELLDQARQAVEEAGS